MSRSCAALQTIDVDGVSEEGPHSSLSPLLRLQPRIFTLAVLSLAKGPHVETISRRPENVFDNSDTGIDSDAAGRPTRMRSGRVNKMAPACLQTALRLFTSSKLLPLLCVKLLLVPRSITQNGRTTEARRTSHVTRKNGDHYKVMRMMRGEMSSFRQLD